MKYTKDSRFYSFELNLYDCMALSFIAYDYFELIFTFSDWNLIRELPMNGISFKTTSPKVVSYLEIGTNHNMRFIDRFQLLSELKSWHEKELMESELVLNVSDRIFFHN